MHGTTAQITIETFKILTVERQLYTCVQPRHSAVNTTLPAFAIERRRPPLSIDISCLQGTQQQTCQPLLLLSIDGTADGRTDDMTDTRPFHRPCSAYCAGSDNTGWAKKPDCF